MARDGVEPPTFRFSVGRSYQLSYLAVVLADTSARSDAPGLATPTGLEPATSAVTGRRANRLRYGALLMTPTELWCVSPTRAAAQTVEVLPGSALAAS